MYLMFSALLLLAYLGNVIYGASNAGQALLGNQGELLLLLGVSVTFVIAILRAERQRNATAEAQQEPGGPPGSASSR